MGARSRLCAPTFCASERPNLFSPHTPYGRFMSATQAAYNEWDASPFMCSNVSCVQNTISLIQTGQLDRAFLRARVCYILYTYIFLYMYLYLGVYISISMCLYIYIYLYLYINTHTRTCIHAHTHTHTHARTRTHTRARTHTCVYTYTYIHTYIYIYIFW